jgi:hypothetical protein
MSKFIITCKACGSEQCYAYSDDHRDNGKGIITMPMKRERLKMDVTDRM